MGTSNWQNISWCVQAIMRIEPKSVLDVGVGFGRWGMVIREFAEVWFDRITPEQWEIELEGIEAFPKNIAPYHEHFYDRIHIGDALEVAFDLEGRWDLTILGDVLEHFYKSDGERLLAHLLDHSDYVLVNLPLGEDWPQEDKYENPYEEHKAVWDLHDFDPGLIRAKQVFLDFQERPFGSILLSRGDPRNLQVGLFGSPRQGEAQAAPAASGDDVLVDSMREKLEAVDAIRASGAWRLVERARNHPLLWHASSLARRHRGEAVTVQHLGREDAQPSELTLARITSDGSPVLWDFLHRRGHWDLQGRQGAAFGEGLSTAHPGDACRWYTYGAAVEIHLVAGPRRGRCRVRAGRRRFDLDLERPTETTVVLDLQKGELREPTSSGPRAVPASRPPETVSLDEEQEQLLERLRKQEEPALAVYVPGWTGIRNSTTTLFEHTHPLPAQLDAATRDRFLLLVREARCRNLVLSGGALEHLHLCREISERLPETRVKLLWHGSFLQVREDYAWRCLRLAFNLARQRSLRAVGFVKEGMAELAEEAGVPGAFVMNYVPRIPGGASKHADGGPHFGMWISNEGWRKVPYAMAAGVSSIPGANLHYNGDRKRLKEFAHLIGLKVQPHGTQLFTGGELRKWMRLMHVNLYVTLSECCPMLPLESLSEGTPCLTGPNSHLFRDDRYLFDRLVVPFPDSGAAIREKALQALEERDAIIAAYAQWAPEYNQRAQQSVSDFLEL